LFHCCHFPSNVNKSKKVCVKKNTRLLAAGCHGLLVSPCCGDSWLSCCVP
jgi:hypothetical protein